MHLHRFKGIVQQQYLRSNPSIRIRMSCGTSSLFSIALILCSIQFLPTVLRVFSLLAYLRPCQGNRYCQCSQILQQLKVVQCITSFIFHHLQGHAHYAGIALEIVGLSLEKRIIGTNFSNDVTTVHVTILLPRISLEAPAARSESGNRIQRGGDMDGPTCSSSFTRTIQACGESSSVQELDPQTYPSLLYKLQAPRLSNLGQK